MRSKKSYMWLTALVLAFVLGAILPNEANAQTKKPRKKVAVKRKVVTKKKITRLRARPTSSPSNTFKISDKDSDYGGIGVDSATVGPAKMSDGPVRDVSTGSSNVPFKVGAIGRPKEEVNKNQYKVGSASGGVVNGKATNLVRPEYPAAARAVGAKGQVSIQVLIDEEGNVISAVAVSGHPLLKAAAADAARRSKFSPTLLQGHPVKVSGTVIYNFQ